MTIRERMNEITEGTIFIVTLDGYCLPYTADIMKKNSKKSAGHVNVIYSRENIFGKYFSVDCTGKEWASKIF